MQYNAAINIKIKNTSVTSSAFVKVTTDRKYFSECFMIFEKLIVFENMDKI